MKQKTFVDNDGRLDWRKLGYHARSMLAVLLAAAVLAGGGWFVYSKAHDAYVAWRTADDYGDPDPGRTPEKAQILIPRGATITAIGELLVDAGVIKTAKAFRKAAQESGEADKLKAGRYNLVKEIPAKTAFEMLLDPANQQHLEIVFPEGTNNIQQWNTYHRVLKIPLDEINKSALNTSQFSLPPYAGGKLEGFMFPAKYQVAEPPVAAAVMKTQINQFNRVAERIGLEGRAAEMGRTPMEIVTVASIIAKEVSNPKDQPMVAAVIYNRLAQKMPLQMDSTVHFAIRDFSRVTTTAAERAIDHPYNTYRYGGLPPGPISNPGQTALEAALSPAATDALFFVTVNLDTGETKFAATNAEHEANKAEFQAWCRANTGRCQGR